MSQDRGDHGTLGDDDKSKSDRGGLMDEGQSQGASGESRHTIPAQITPSYDMFGNQLMPAVAEPVQTVQDRGPIPGAGATAAQQTQPPSSSTPVTTAPAKAQTSMVTYVIAGIGVLAVAGYFGFKTWKDAQPAPAVIATTTTLNGPSGQPQTTISTVTAATTTGGMSANEVFKQVSPSVVTLTISSTGYAVVSPDLPLIDPFASDVEQDSTPIMALTNDDGNFVLYQKNKALDEVAGQLKSPQGKILVHVRLVKGKPVIFDVDEEGKPVKGKDGNPIVRIGKFAPFTATGIGTGFFVRPDIVATNWHVVSQKSIGDHGFAGGTAQITDQPAKFLVTDKPIAFDKDHDLALVYVPGTGSKPVTMRVDYSTLKVGEPVYAIGSPHDLTGSISEGIISSDKLRANGLYLQHSAKIDHGNSGGPLVDTAGQVIGVNSAFAGNGAINLAVPVHFIEDLLSQPSTQKKIEELKEKNKEKDLQG